MGYLGYGVSSNDIARRESSDMKFKFEDDLSTLEKLNLILAGLISYDFKNHVASDIGINQSFLPKENSTSQKRKNPKLDT